MEAHHYETSEHKYKEKLLKIMQKKTLPKKDQLD